MRVVPYQNRANDVFKKFLDDGFFFSLPFSSLSEGQSSFGAGDWYPALDLLEEKEQYILKADLPGIKKEDIKISFEHGVLRIDGERTSESEHKDRQVHRSERSYGRFVRVINLGTDVDQNKIHANYKDGILEVIVPKSERAKPKSIDIHVG